MALIFLASILIIFVSLARADKFVFPDDSSDTTATQIPVFLLGQTQTFTWTTSASSVALVMYQDATDYEGTLSPNCSGGSWTWNGATTFDLTQGVTFFLEIHDDTGLSLAQSKDFNISEDTAAVSTSAISSAQTSSIRANIETSTTASTTTSPASLSESSTSILGTTSTSISISTTTSSAPAIAPPIAPNGTPQTSPHVASTSTPGSASLSTSSNTPTASSSQASTPAQSKSNTKVIALGTGGGIAFALLGTLGVFLFLRRRKSQHPVRAQSPPPWSPGTEAVVPEAKGPHQRYDRVEMEVPNSPSVKSPIPGAVQGNGGFSKAELPPETCEKGLDEGGGSKRVQEFIGVELP